MEQSWRVLERRTLVDRRPWYSIEEQRIQLPDGRVVEDFPRIELRDYAIVVALTPAGEVLTHRMYKHGTGRMTLDLVAGLIEDGEQPLPAAKRELREETGYESDRWSTLGSYVVNSNYGCGRMHAFVAEMCVASPNRIVATWKKWSSSCARWTSRSTTSAPVVSSCCRRPRRWASPTST